MSLVDQYRDETLTRSQRDWFQVRDHLQRHRYELGQAAADLYPGVARVAGTPLLRRPEWLPAEPLPLDAITSASTPTLRRNWRGRGQQLAQQRAEVDRADEPPPGRPLTLGSRITPGRHWTSAAARE